MLNIPVDGPGLVGGELGEPVQPSQLGVLRGGSRARQHLNLDQTDQRQTSGLELLIRHQKKKV